MKKSLIITIAAALLLAAVILTAGCVSEDQVVGTYVAENDSAVIYAVFEKEGTGGFVEFTKDADISDAAGLPFKWKADGGSAYTLAFADGTTDTAALDAQRGLMTIGGVEFEKMVSVLSGSSNGLSEDEKRDYFSIWLEKHPDPTGDELDEIFNILDNWDRIEIIDFIYD